MQYIFTNRMVAHVWAQQSQSDGRSSNGNASFVGDTLYSYTARIARFTVGANGQPVILVSDGSQHRNSITTSGHISCAMSAASGHGPIFRVPNIGYGGTPSMADHAANMLAMLAEYQKNVANLRRKRSVDAYHYEWLTERAETIATYIDAFNLADDKPDASADTAAIREFRATRDARNNTPEQIAKRERDTARRAELRIERETRAQELAILAATDAIAAWRQGHNSYLPYDARVDANGGALLRIRGNALETSHGASVPLADAIAAFRRIAACRDAGIGWQRNGATIRVGHFQIDQINPDGSFRAGCHVINWPEVQAAAVAAGVSDQTAWPFGGDGRWIMKLEA